MRALIMRVALVVLGSSVAPISAQVAQSPDPPPVAAPAADPPSPERLRACKSQAAAKRDPDVREAFIKFCLAYDGSAAASVFAWNKATLRK